MNEVDGVLHAFRKSRQEGNALRVMLNAGDQEKVVCQSSWNQTCRPAHKDPRPEEEGRDHHATWA
ncbi:MAG: hypothetical protein ACKPKO_38460, partial [Candidatus Fonsibacter sp.]